MLIVLSAFLFVVLAFVCFVIFICMFMLFSVRLLCRENDMDDDIYGTIDNDDNGEEIYGLIVNDAGAGASASAGAVGPSRPPRTPSTPRSPVGSIYMYTIKQTSGTAASLHCYAFYHINQSNIDTPKYGKAKSRTANIENLVFEELTKTNN